MTTLARSLSALHTEYQTGDICLFASLSMPLVPQLRFMPHSYSQILNINMFTIFAWLKYKTVDSCAGMYFCLIITNISNTLVLIITIFEHQLSCDVGALSVCSSYNCLDANNEDIGHREVTENYCSDVDFKEVIMQDCRITKQSSNNGWIF